jgi:hypothetical protein
MCDDNTTKAEIKKSLYLPTDFGWTSEESTVFESRFSIGELVKVRFFRDSLESEMLGVINRVIFEAKKVRYDIWTFDGGIYEGVYSDRVYSFTHEDLKKDILTDKELYVEVKEWIVDKRKEIIANK